MLNYARGRRRRVTEQTPEEQRRNLVRFAAVALIAALAWWSTLFWTRRPAIDFFCVCAFIPLFMTLVWLFVGWQSLALARRDPMQHRKRLIALSCLAFFLAPYSLMRAGSDMFTLSVRYHVWRAGGADRVRAAFNQWVASQPVYDPSDGRRLLFARVSAGGRIVSLPVTQFPPEVRYIHEKFPSRFGMTWKDVARLDNVSVLTETDIMIGPPGWEPEGGMTLWHHLTGSRRKLADGIWIRFGTYNK